jgi:hypothetical protein
MSKLLGVRIELVEASTGTESICVSAEDFGVAATRLDLPPADRIFRRRVHVWSSPIMPFMPTVTVDHMGAAAEPHHEKEERSE